nr:MAG TPA: hypothetical protein [Caudoviricetes sp.]
MLYMVSVHLNVVFDLDKIRLYGLDALFQN